MPMTTTAAIIAGAGALKSGISIAQGASQKKQAKNALRDLKVPELDNLFKDIQISTLGSDLMKQEGQRTSADLVDAVRSGGVRSVMGGLPQIASQNNTVNNNAALLLDNQVQKRDYAIAADEARIQQLKENRYQNDLKGIGEMYNAGNQNMWNGIDGMFSSIAAGANGLQGPKPKVRALSNPASIGVQSVPSNSGFDIGKIRFN